MTVQDGDNCMSHRTNINDEHYGGSHRL